MTTPAADDFEVIRKKMEYERGFAAGLAGTSRVSPDGCLHIPSWLEGFDEGTRCKPKGE